MSSLISIDGAGPGNPELLTIKFGFIFQDIMQENNEGRVCITLPYIKLSLKIISYVNS
jgi:hypothetical protein